MKKPGRLFILTLVTGVVLVAVFVLAVNLYVQSAGMQKQLRSELSEAVGLPVNFFRTTFSPWGGFRVQQISVASAHQMSNYDLLRADCLEVRCNFLPLLTGRTVLNRIVLHSPVFVIQEKKNREKLFVDVNPKKTLLQEPVDLTKTFPEVIRPPQAVSLGDTTPPNASFRLAKLSLNHDFDIQKIQIRNGTFRFLDETGAEFCSLESVRCTMNARSTFPAFSGLLEIKKMVVLGYLEIEKIRSPLTFDGKKLRAEKLEGNMASGDVKGLAEGDFSTPDFTYNFSLELRKAHLEPLIPPTSLFAEEIFGKIRGEWQMSGILGKKHTNLGHAEVTLSGIKLGKIPFLQVVGGIAGTNLSNIRVSKTLLIADIVDSNFKFQPSVLTNANVGLGFSGLISSENNLDLHLKLILDESVFKKMPSETKVNFVNDSEGKKVLDFALKGSLSAPESDLQDRLIGNRLPKALRSLLGGKTLSDVPTDKTPLQP